MTLFFLMEIHSLEEKAGTVVLLNTPVYNNLFSYLRKRFLELKFALIRVEFAYESTGYIADLIVDGVYSMSAVIVAVLHNVTQQNIGKVLKAIGADLESRGFICDGEWDKQISFVRKYERENMPLAK